MGLTPKVRGPHIPIYGQKLTAQFPHLLVNRCRREETLTHVVTVALSRRRYPSISRVFHRATRCDASSICGCPRPITASLTIGRSNERLPTLARPYLGGLRRLFDRTGLHGFRGPAVLHFHVLDYYIHLYSPFR